MDRIILQQVLPAVFAETPPTDSDIWLRDVEFSRGGRYLVEAASGTGKTSLCSYIYGYRNDYSGTIAFDGTDCRELGISQWSHLRRNRISMLFQDLRLFPELSASENIFIKNNLTHRFTVDRIRELFEMTGISEKWNAPVSRLSFGQQQRVAFIRSLCQPFDFIFLDEPVSHLDDRNAGIMTGILSGEAARSGAAVIVTSIGKHLPMDYDKIYKL